MEERQLTGWRAWLKSRPTLFGYVYAAGLIIMMVIGAIDRYWPHAAIVGLLIGMGILIGANI